MFLKNKARGFTLLEFLFAAFLLAVLTVTGLVAVQQQAKTDFLQKDISEMDHVAYSILEMLTLEIRNAGSHSEVSPPFFFVDGGEEVDKNLGKCDIKSANEQKTDCITFESTAFNNKNGIKKSFFVQRGVLKLYNSDKSRTQSLTPDDTGVRVEDFQVNFIMDGDDDFQTSMGNKTKVEAVRITLTLKSRGLHKNRNDAYEFKTYSVVANPRNM